jgi:hypothetical protein
MKPSKTQVYTETALALVAGRLNATASATRKTWCTRG